MTTILIRVVLPIALLAVGLGVLLALGQRPTPESREDAGKDDRPLVETAAVAAHESGLEIPADGVVVPYREITLAAEVAGTVTYKSPHCNEGTYVAAGMKLLQIDPSDYELEVRLLEGELEQSRVNLQELKVELENAEQKLPLAERELALREAQQNRIKSLRSQRVVSEEQLEEAERQVIAAKNALLEAKRLRDALRTRVARLESAIKVDQAQLEKAQLNLKRTTITAPVDGVVIRDDVEQDSYVQQGATVVAVEDTSKVEIRCNLRMEEMRWIWQQRPAVAASAEGSASFQPLSATGQGESSADTDYHSLPPTDVTVQYELGGRVYTWQGTLDRYDGLGLDEKTRMVPCRILVHRPHAVSVDGEAVSLRGPRSLVRGMYVGLVIHARPQTPLLRVPQRAIQPGNFVWRVREGKLERVRLQIAQSNDDAVLVPAESAGLQSGDRLVVSPLQAAYTGLEVREEIGS